MIEKIQMIVYMSTLSIGVFRFKDEPVQVASLLLDPFT